MIILNKHFGSFMWAVPCHVHCQTPKISYFSLLKTFILLTKYLSWSCMFFHEIRYNLICHMVVSAVTVFPTCLSHFTSNFKGNKEKHMHCNYETKHIFVLDKCENTVDKYIILWSPVWIYTVWESPKVLYVPRSPCSLKLHINTVNFRTMVFKVLYADLY